MVKTENLSVKTKGNCDVVNITGQVGEFVSRSGLREGTVTVFNVGSTAGITTTEYEPGLVNYDLEACFEKIAPERGLYEHEKTWHDDNGHAHVRASLLGPSMCLLLTAG
jgi:secondary thiamine-phosphate synthase enzyme